MKENKTPTADISFEVGYKNDKTRFNLRLISVAEETETTQKLNDLADNDVEKAGKEYNICLDALCAFSHAPEDAAALRERFADFNVRNERIVRGAFNQFRYALAPTVDFL